MHNADARKGIGARMARVRRTNHLTQVQVARSLKVSQSFVSLVEHGDRELTFRQAIDLAGVLNVSLDYLAGLENGYRKVGT